MSDLKPNIQEDKDVELVSDSPGCAKEPLWSSTFSLKNNPIHTIGLSSDEHHKPLNGAQSNPFVYSSVPAVPCVDNSLPSGALVNGPGSHPTTEVHSVLNKGTVLSNNVLDAAWQVEKDTSAEVLPPPSELQSDAWKNTVGIAVKTLATQPGVNTPLSHLEENGSKLAYSALSGDGAEQMNISQPWTQQTIETGTQHSVEWSESSTDDCDDVEVIKWDSTRERLLHNDGGLETSGIRQREMQHNTHVKSMASSLEKVNNSLNHTPRRFCSGNDVENVDIANKSDSLDTERAIEYSVLPFKSLPASNSEQHIHSAAQNGCNEEDDPEDEDTFSPKLEQLKTKQLGQDLSFFSCTICNVNFRGKRNFHRHMMYHLGKHNQVKSENVSQTFICRECGRLFCDRNSLMSHIIIHQDRLEKLMEEIKDLKNTDAEDRGAIVHCPQCEYGCSCPKISVQHAETHDNLKHYYFCEECNYITLTQQALELHLHVAHLDSHQPQFRKMTHTNDAEEADHVHFQCKMGFFKSRDTVVLGRHSDLENQPSHSGNYKNSSGQPKIAGCKPNRSKSTFGELAHFPHCSSENEDIYIQKSDDKTKNSLFKHYVDYNKNTLSPSLWRISKHGKLLLQPVEKLDVATDLTCVEENAEKNDHEAFGNSKQANCPATADASPSSRSLNLEQMLSQDSKNDLDRSSQAKANQNSASMIKMSTPLQNTIDMNGNILPRLSQRCKNHSADGRLEKDCESVHNFSGNTNRATGSFLESSENERNPYARKYIRKRQRFSGKKNQSPHQLTDEDEGDDDCSDIEQLIIKEEYIETTVCDTSPESLCTPTSDSFVASPSQVIEHKVCPYCPAMFESGVGLSNHVRGHLHRVGLSYNARHMVSPEQVALQDHQPRTRRRIPAGRRKIRRAVKTETQGEHTCPLCCGWFDTRTGLSNHVRGHLKRIGGSVTGTSKSPLCILNELLQDKEEHRNILQILEKDQFLSGPSAAQKFISRSGLVLMHTALPAEIIQHEMKSQHATGDRFLPKQEAQVTSERDKLQENAQRGITRSSSTLVELLKMRQESMELAARNNQDAYPVRKLCVMTKDYKETQMTGVEPERTSGECDLSEICHDCNSNFPAAVSLSGHLQAYTCRKRIAVFEETGYDYKQKKPRPRPGLKKKILPSLNAQIYTLTCRFCDLVFQGPLSIQEDWVKHLQRHLLHTSVPHSGTGMVEVLGPRHKLQISMTHEHPDAR